MRLHSRACDAQALKALFVAHQHGKQLATSTGKPQAGACPLACSSLALLDAGGNVLATEPNLLAQLVGGSLCDAAMTKWLEWESVCLRPAVLLHASARHASDSQPLVDALKHLATSLGSSGGKCLVGSEVSLADVAVYATLQPLVLQQQLPPGTPSVDAYLEAVGKAPAVQQARQQLLAEAGDAGERAMVGPFVEDAEASAASRPLLPIPGQRNILVTSALPYVNNVPHLGNIIGCVLSADCYARYCRARGYNTIFICGTDEYGTATETKALEEGLSCGEVCDKYYTIHKATYDWFDCKFDRFGRTPTRWQTKICQSVFQQLDAKGYLKEQTMEQLYSEALGKFLADRYVTGTCPKCRYEDARGDQCDGCGNLLNPTELINPKCKMTGTTPVRKQTKHLFLDLPQLSPALQEYITKTSQLGGWTSNCVQVTNAWMRDGLKPRCITRDLKWGTPVPRQGYEDKVFYVWFDAPIGYVSITAGYTEEWEKWWKNPKEVELTQFMGKDNVPFHTVIFPATQLGTGDPWTLMRSISVTEYLNYEGGKFSKSRGTGVFGTDAEQTGIPVEVWRYYLLSVRPEQQDTDFKWADLQARNNSELLANLGNFINRGLMFVSKFFGGKVPQVHPTKGAEELAELGRNVAPKVQEYIAAMEHKKLREGIRIAMSVSAEGNKFLQDTKPWELVKKDPEHAASVVAASVGMIRLIAGLIQPYMPSLTARAMQQMALPVTAANLTDAVIAGASAPHTLSMPGHAINTPSPLVTNIPDSLIAEMRARYGGTQAERDAKESTAQPGQQPQQKGAGKPQQGGKPAPKDGGSGAGKKEGAAAASGDGKAAKKEGSGGGKKGEDEEARIDMLDIRVGQITKVDKHPNADALYLEEINVGEEQPRQVISGLVKHVPIEEMQGRKVAVICNLKPAKMRDVMSYGMVLCACTESKDRVVPVLLPDGSQPGERISVAGFDQAPVDEINPKKKILERLFPDMKTDAAGVPGYKGAPFATSRGQLTSPVPNAFVA